VTGVQTCLFRSASSYTSTNNQWLVAKYSQQGAFVWQRPAFPNGYILVDNQENVIVAGVSNVPPFSDWNLVITKYGPDGITLWTRSRLYSNNRLYFGDWRLDANNAIYLAGTVETNSQQQSTFISLLKYSPDGDLQWEVKYARVGYRYTDARVGYPYNDFGAMGIDSARNIYLAASTSVTGATNESIILKYEQASSAARLSVRTGLTLADPMVLSLFAKAGQTYRIDSSTDLLQWTSFTNVSNAFGTAETVIPAPISSGRKFYRAVWENP